MATAVSYPGVYIEEVPSAVRAIAGVPTSVTAFVGYTRRGTLTPTQIFSFADFERAFGGLDLDSELSYAVNHFYLNGGGTAWIARVAAGAFPAAVDLENNTGGGGDVVLTATARSAGAWGNNLRLTIDYVTANPASLFNMTVAEVAEVAGRLTTLRTEVHRNLSMNSFSPAFAASVVNAASGLVTLERPGGLVFANAGQSVSGLIADTDLALLGDNARRLAISIDGGPIYEFDVFPEGGGLVGADYDGRMDDLASRIEAAVQGLEPANPAFANFAVSQANDGTLGRITMVAGAPASDPERSSVVVTSASRRNAAIILRMGVANGGRETEAAAAMRPAQSGTAWLRAEPPTDFATLDTPGQVEVNLLDASGGVLHNETLGVWTLAADSPGDLEHLRSALQAAFAGSTRRELATTRVLVADDRLVFVPGGDDPGIRIAFAAGITTGGGAADLSTGAEANLAAYRLGTGAVIAAQSNPVPGADGTPPNPVQLVGSRAAKTGIFALEDVDLFNLLLIPGQSDAALQAAAIAYATERRAFVILDLPAATDTPAEAQAWLNANGTLRHRNAAAYFPRLRAADPLQQNRIRSFANSGALAGLYARTDRTRGVWKAPAGTEAQLRGAQGLDYVLTDAENGVLNPLGLNALRSFPAFGVIGWGARTLFGSDALASEWKYLPVRRLALFIEESLYRGTQWVVFEPNDEPLWSQIRLNVGTFMQTLFRQGAFQGRTPREAYLVQCDATTTTQADIDLGIVNIVVGFAPLKPAEFVIIKLQLLAGQAQA